MFSIYLSSNMGGKLVNRYGKMYSFLAKYIVLNMYIYKNAIFE